MKYPFLVLLLLTFGPTLKSQNSPISEVYDYIINFQEDERSLYRFYQIDSSPERRERFMKFYEDQQKKLSVFEFDQLSVGGQVDYLMMKKRIDDRLYRLQIEKEEYQQIEGWVKVGEKLYNYEKLRRRGIKQDAAEMAKTFASIQKSFIKIGNKVVEEEEKLPRKLTERASSVMQGYKEVLQSLKDFYGSYDPDYTWWVSKASESLFSTLDEVQSTFEESIDASTFPKDDGSGIIGSPIGREELIRQLQIEMIPYSPEDLVDIAMKEFAWCDKELLKASREMGFGDDWKSAQEKVKMSFVPPGEQPQAMLELYNQSVDFLKKNDLLSIPPLAEETWRMTMISPERQKISPFFLGGEVLQISYPTEEMEHEDKMMSMRGNNPHFSRSTVHHELIAGHHLQQFVNRRNHEYRNFRTPFWTEGWALYWELLLWDMDFPRSPEDRIGMLFWRMHRCARIIFSLNYHLGEWTPQECIDYLVDRVGHERANAEGEVRRSFEGNYGPLYQIAYMVGGMQFWALKDELVKSGKMTYKEFHDAVLEENAMPVEMLRSILLDQKLEKDFRTSWRFYD